MAGKSEEPKRKGGRPRGGFLPRYDIDWDVVETYYVQGEIIVEKNKSGDLKRVKPSYADCARRFKCSKGAIYHWAKKRKWREKRETWERQAAKMVADEVMKSRALSFAEAASILDAWLLQFQEMLVEKKVRTDSLSDFNTAMRLKRFIDEQGSAGTEQRSAFTLEDLERKHRAMRDETEAERDAGDALTGALAKTEYEGAGDESVH